MKRPKINEIEAGDGPFKKIICVYQADADAQAEQAADGRQERDPGLPRLAVELENGRVFKVHLQRTFDRYVLKLETIKANIQRWIERETWVQS